MTRHRDSAEPRDFIDESLRVEPDIGEIEAREDVVVDAEHQHVAVVGLDFRRAQHHHAELVFERAIVGLAVELAMLGQDDSVDRTLGAPQPDPVEVRLYRCAAVFGRIAMRMQIKGCAQAAKFLTSPGEISRASPPG